MDENPFEMSPLTHNQIGGIFGKNNFFTIRHCIMNAHKNNLRLNSEFYYKIVNVELFELLSIMQTGISDHPPNQLANIFQGK